MIAPVPDHEGVTGRRSRPLVFVADLDAPELDDADHHHLAKALRVVVGSEITVSDGAGHWRCVRFGAELEPIGAVMFESRPSIGLTVAFTPVKGDRPEWTVQKLTELGIDRIIPLQTDRSVVRWDAQRAVKQHQRWERVVREAASQSRRVWLPLVEPVTPFGSLRSAFDSRAQLSLAEPGGRPLGVGDHVVCVGPEGGWSERELSEVDADQLVSLPGGILRAETAALGAAVIMALHRNVAPVSEK